MDSLLPYMIPVKGLSVGPHQYEFIADGSFFRSFEDSPIEEAQVKVELVLDKRPDMLVLEFSFAGYVASTCDRCLVGINLPVKGEQRVLVKYSWDKEESTDEDVVYIHPDSPKLQVAPFVYEFIVLSLPLIKVYECEADERPPCDQAMLSYLEEQEEEENPDTPDNPFKEALKGWKKPK